jgi:hypothetical protein
LAAEYVSEAGNDLAGLATFQVLRKTNATLSKKAGVDPKVASDQRGHGLGVSMEVYTSSDMEQKRRGEPTRRHVASRSQGRTPISVNGRTLQ